MVGIESNSSDVEALGPQIHNELADSSIVNLLVGEILSSNSINISHNYFTPFSMSHCYARGIVAEGEVDMQAVSAAGLTNKPVR